MARQSRLPLVLGLVTCAGGCVTVIVGLALMAAELLPDAMRPGFWTAATGVAIFVAGLVTLALAVILGVFRRKAEPGGTGAGTEEGSQRQGA